jgi:hypothetical protein
MIDPVRYYRQIIDLLSIAQGKRRKDLRQRKDDLKVRGFRYDQFQRFVEPIGSTSTSAVRTMTITTRVEYRGFDLTLVAAIDSLTQILSSTEVHAEIEPVRTA